MKLKLADGLSLPLDAVTQTIAVLAKRRAGKSYTMRRFVEQLFHAGQQVVLVDPKGDQWGVRSAADGKAPGLAIVILGGERGDVPLEPSGGEVVAKLVVEERVSVLLDLSLFRKHEVATFMTAFLENLYRLKAREQYRTPMMLVIDEADAIAPQKPQKGEERMLGAAEDIVRRGGQRGIGCVLVTQRSAVLNKNVLTQAQMLVALRTIAPQDLAAMDAWIQVHGTDEQRKMLMESLPSLPVGDAWFWSPGWPTTDGIFKRVHVLPIETFDSGAPPPPPPVVVELPTHDGTMPAEFDDWASQIIDEAGTKADSQVQWEIVEALQKAWRLGISTNGRGAPPQEQHQDWLDACHCADPAPLVPGAKCRKCHRWTVAAVNETTGEMTTIPSNQEASPRDVPRSPLPVRRFELVNRVMLDAPKNGKFCLYAHVEEALTAARVERDESKREVLGWMAERKVFISKLEQAEAALAALRPPPEVVTLIQELHEKAIRANVMFCKESIFTHNAGSEWPDVDDSSYEEFEHCQHPWCKYVREAALASPERGQS